MALWGTNQEDDEFFGDFEEESEEDRPIRDSLRATSARSTGNTGRQTASTTDHDGLLLRDSEAINDQFRNMGYLEAFDASKEIRLQQGFNQGYRQLFNVSTRVGEMLGEATARARMSTAIIGETVKGRADHEQVEEVARRVRSFFVEFDKEADITTKQTHHQRLLNLETTLRTHLEDKTTITDIE